jgi:hypothetical protein
MKCVHDYNHPVYKGRANLRCPKCDEDITLFCVFMEDAMLNSQSKRPYNKVDHYHCWEQGGEPACGLPLKTHDICCLCAITKDKKTAPEEAASEL